MRQIDFDFKPSKRRISKELLYNNIKSPEIRLTYTRLRIGNNVYSSYMRSKVVGICTCPYVTEAKTQSNICYFHASILINKGWRSMIKCAKPYQIGQVLTYPQSSSCC